MNRQEFERLRAEFCRSRDEANRAHQEVMAEWDAVPQEEYFTARDRKLQREERVAYAAWTTWCDALSILDNYFLKNESR